jgi:UDP-N-acetylglucosamine:LPS N-acetylglucosamine transferase
MKPNEIKNKRILFSVLNWGLGHVARSISIIHQLNLQNNTVFVACSENQKKIFLDYFPNINYIQHNDYPFSFKGKGNFALDLFLSFPSLSSRLKKEKKEVKLLIKKHDIDICISDHRYGFHAKECTSIFITHQLNLPLPLLFKCVNILHHQLIKKFNYIWVLDTKNSIHAGKLSVNKKFKNLYYIGIQSRFGLYPKTEKCIEKVVIISGPEPYAEQFFQSESKKAEQSKEEVVIITPKHYSNSTKTNIIIQLSDDWKKCDEIILKAKKIVSRSGYSTLMDLAYLACEKELIPTPGQYEQAYLLSHTKLN